MCIYTGKNGNNHICRLGKHLFIVKLAKKIKIAFDVEDIFVLVKHPTADSFNASSNYIIEEKQNRAPVEIVENNKTGHQTILG